MIMILSVNVRAEIFVNGIPVCFVARYPDEQVVVVPIDHFATEGANELMIIVNGGRTPSSVASDDQDSPSLGGGMPFVEGRIRVTIGRYADGSMVSKTEVPILLQAEWRGDSRRSTQIVRQSAESLSLSRWAFQRADPLSDRDLEDVRTVVQELHDSIERGDSELLISLSSTKLSELSQAFEMDQSSMADGLRLMIARHHDDPNWVFSPLDWKLTDFRMCAQSRLVEIINLDWIATLRYTTKGSDENFYLPMFLGRIGGSWHVLR